MTVVRVLEESQRFKLDRSDDALFYNEPRFVHHLDAPFRERLTTLYRQKLPPCACGSRPDEQLGQPPSG
jgi:hypothetical protein